MAPQPLSQQEYFYYVPWSIFSETICLVEMDTAVKEGRWQVGDVGELHPTHISHLHRKISSSPYFLGIDLNQLISKLWEWQGRVRRFQQLIDDRRVNVDDNTHRVTADGEVWEDLRRQNPLFCCYMETGELNWPLLKLLFQYPSNGTTLNEYVTTSRKVLLSLSRNHWGPTIEDTASVNQDSDNSLSPEI